MKTPIPPDTPIELVAWSSLEVAYRRALADAVNSCGVVGVVYAVEVEARRFALIGQLPVAAVERPANIPPGRPTVRADRGGRLHSTFEAISKPGGCLGYYVLSPPLRLIAGVPRELEGHLSVVVEIDRSRRATDGYAIGSRCCANCAVQLPKARVEALPAVKLCHDCQLDEEKGEMNAKH